MSVKKKILSVTASLLLLTVLTLPAGAVSVDVTDPDAMLPVDIIIDQDNKEIRKVYDLSPNTDPSTLPMGQFERDGLLYDCTDVLREVIIGNLPQAVITLPRQILLPYFILAALALIVLAGLRFLLRNKKAMIMWIDRAILFPISYMAAQLCTKGINFTTYSSQRDFCIIALVAILLYLALLTGKSLYQEKRADKNTERFKEQP